MKKFQLTLLLSLMAVVVYGQDDKISYEKVFGGYKYTQQSDQALSLKQMAVIMANNEEAIQYIKKAKTNQNLGMVTSTVGGFLVGYPLGTALAGGDPNWAMLGIGAVIVAITIPITSSASKNANMAVDIYNSGINPRPHPAILSFGPTQHGIGLSLNF